MNKRTASIWSFAFLLVGVAILLWWRTRNEVVEGGCETTQSHQPPAAPSVVPSASGTAAPFNPLQALLQTPILFYGIVLDQDGQPIPGANVSASVVDNVVRGTPVSTTADATGKFTIQSKGASLHVEVSNNGYGRVEPGGTLRPSSQGFDYGADVGRGIHRPDSASPVIFQLRKPLNPVRLEPFNANPIVPRDGSPIDVNISKTGKAILQVRCRTVEDSLVPNAPYDWRCEVGVKGGGIQERNDDYSVEAPADGYAPSIVIDMPKTLDVKEWSSRVSKYYWVRFPDNTFARIDFRMHARGDHFAVIEGFRNPTPDDRNLERKVESR